LSNHEVQYLVLDKISVNDKSTLAHRMWLTNTLNNCTDVLKNETWENIYTMNHNNDILKVFLKTFLIYSDSCFPIQYITRKQKNNKWITWGIKTSCRRKQGLYILSIIRKCSLIKLYYLHYCRILRVIRMAKLMCITLAVITIWYPHLRTNLQLHGGLYEMKWVNQREKPHSNFV
jgi:hypothetical protein